MAVNRFLLIPRQDGYRRNIYPKNPVIYKIVNCVNNKCYIGQTSRFNERLNKHYFNLIHNKHHSSPLQRAFNKYGINNFYIEIIEESTRDLIADREVYWINKFQSYNRKNGYNIVIGKLLPAYGKRSKQTCLNISKSLIGKHPSIETRKKQSLARLGRFKGKDSGLAKSIIQYDINMNLIKNYESVIEASKSTQIRRTAISNCLSGYSRTSGGFIWKYKENVLWQAA